MNRTPGQKLPVYDLLSPHAGKVLPANPVELRSLSVHNDPADLPDGMPLSIFNGIPTMATECAVCAGMGRPGYLAPSTTVAVAPQDGKW